MRFIEGILISYIVSLYIGNSCSGLSCLVCSTEKDPLCLNGSAKAVICNSYFASKKNSSEQLGVKMDLEHDVEDTDRGNENEIDEKSNDNHVHVEFKEDSHTHSCLTVISRDKKNSKFFAIYRACVKQKDDICVSKLITRRNRQLTKCYCNSDGCNNHTIDTKINVVVERSAEESGYSVRCSLLILLIPLILTVSNFRHENPLFD